MVDGGDDDLATDGRGIRAGILLQNPIAHGDVRGRAAKGFDGLFDHLPDGRFCFRVHELAVFEYIYVLV